MSDEANLAALRARVAELEAILVELAELKIHKDAFGKTEDYQRRQPLAWKRVRQAVNAAVTPTRDPRDARIAELEAKLAEVEEQHLTYLQRLCCDIALKQASDGRSAAGRIAELEAALREIRSKSGDQWSIDTADRALGDGHG